MKHVLASVLIIALLATAPVRIWAKLADTTLDQPPPGIVATTATLSQVLAAHEKAVGRLSMSADPVSTELWDFTKAGEQGNERLVQSGTDYHATITTGPFVEQYGQSDGTRWYMNENGAVTTITETDLRSFEMFRVLEDAADPKNDVKLLGETTDAQPAYVVQVSVPHLKHPEFVYYDKKTALVDKTQLALDDDKLVSTYDDYQTVRGLTEPAHMHDSNGTPALDDDFRRQSINFATRASSSEFAQPESSANFAQISKPVDLKARIINNTVIVRLNINGRGLDFELSSGDSASYIDWEVAKELNLPSFGRVTELSAEQLPYETKIDHAWAGDLYLQDFAVTALPFHYHADANTQVVGVLGYDFLVQGLVTVDYVNGRVSASPNSTATFDPFTSGYNVIPVQFDDGQPFFDALIGTHNTANVLLDSSFDLSFILGSFTQQYPDAVPDMYQKQHVHTIVPFADNGSYGRDADVWLANVPDLQVGPMNFQNYRVFATDMDYDVGDHPVDAVLGAEFLQFFDVSYDYAHDRVLLKENALFHRYFRVSSH